MDELVAAAPRPRTTCELQYSDCKLRSPLKGLCLLLSPPYAITAPIDDEANTQIIGTSNPGRSATKTCAEGGVQDRSHPTGFSGRREARAKTRKPQTEAIAVAIMAPIIQGKSSPGFQKTQPSTRQSKQKSFPRKAGEICRVPPKFRPFLFSSARLIDARRGNYLLAWRYN